LNEHLLIERVTSSFSLDLPRDFINYAHVHEGELSGWIHQTPTEIYLSKSFREFKSQCFLLSDEGFAVFLPLALCIAAEDDFPDFILVLAEQMRFRLARQAKLNLSGDVYLLLLHLVYKSLFALGSDTLKVGKDRGECIDGLLLFISQVSITNMSFSDW
jgi:hypothetical protein